VQTFDDGHKLQSSREGDYAAPAGLRWVNVVDNITTTAVLTGSTEAFTGNDVIDPTGRVANLWFQGTKPHEEPRQRFHLDLWVPPEVVPGRIEAALAAGGKVVYDEEAPAFIVLADPQGNKVCLCTSEGR